MLAKKPRNLEESMSEVKREINVRQRCYDKWVSEGKMTAIDAQDRMDRIVSAEEWLTALSKMDGTLLATAGLDTAGPAPTTA